MYWVSTVRVREGQCVCGNEEMRHWGSEAQSSRQIDANDAADTRLETEETAPKCVQKNASPTLGFSFSFSDFGQLKMTF